MDKKSFLLKKSVKEIEVPTWKESIFIRKFSAGERIKLLKDLTVIEGKNVEVNAENMFNTEINVVILSLCDENGERWFDDTNESFEAINSIDADVIEFISDKALIYNGLGVETEKEALKNSDTSQN